MAQPVKFWPDGQEPPFTGQKIRKRTFVTDGKGQPSKEITRNYPEIDRLKTAQRSTQIFHPRTGDILLYHDYSDYEDSESDFDASEDDEIEIYDGVVTTSSKATSRWNPPESILNQCYSRNALVHLETARHWIKQGKKFPSDPLSTPYPLQQLCAAVLTVPKKFSAPLLPPEDISVEDLINFPIPGVSIRNHEGSITFQEELPTSEVSPTRELPAMADVEVLREKFGQALLDGKCSISDPRFKDQLFPLWTIEFWWQLHGIHAKKKKWNGAQRWLQNLVAANRDEQIFHEAAKQLCKLPANKLLRGPAAHSSRRTNSLVRFLSSSEWLSEPLIDVMVANLVDRFGAKQKEFIVASTSFTDAIMSAREISYHDKPHSHLLKFEEAAKTHRYLCIPAHIRLTSHFIAFEIDFHARTVRYGDSLDHNNTQKAASGAGSIITRLQWWFEKRFHGKFTDLGPTLPHGNQEDRCSCGLFAINTIEHRVLGHPLGILNTDYERARWFNLTAKDQIPDLRVPGLSATLPAIEMNVLLSGQVVANQESEIRRIKDMKTSYLEKQAQRRASRNEALAGHEPEKMDLDRTEKEK
ncbi:hypothetical protein P692DRAFT_20823821, partial [Suillus brevipes Sb2]